MVELGAQLAGVTEERPARTRSAHLPSLRFATLPADAAARIASQWAALAERAADDNLFLHPDFAMPAISHLGGRDVRIATVVTSGGRLVALAPVARARLGRIAPAVRLWSHRYGPLGLPLIAEDVVEEAVASLVEGLAPGDGRTSLLVPDLPLDGPVAQAIVRFSRRSERPVAVLNRHARAMLDRTADGLLDLRGVLSTKRRKEINRQMRRLGDLGSVSMETTVEPDRVRARFEEFLALEAAGWKGRRGTALASTAATAEFGREVVFNRADGGAVRIDSIRVGARPVAIIVAFVGGATAFTWKIAYDEAYARFSPGAQLMLRVAGSLFSDPAVARIDSCAVANHPMVDHLWSGRMAIGTLVIGPRGGRGVYQIGLAMASAEFVARANARRLRDRLR